MNKTGRNCIRGHGTYGKDVVKVDKSQVTRSKLYSQGNMWHGPYELNINELPNFVKNADINARIHIPVWASKENLIKSLANFVIKPWHLAHNENGVITISTGPNITALVKRLQSLSGNYICIKTRVIV